MTFNKMRSPIVWITLALCVVLCAIEVRSGPVDHQDLRITSKDYTLRSGRQEPYDEDSGEENDDGSNEEGGDDAGEGDDDDGEDEGRRLKGRHVREASQKPLLVNNDETDEESVIPTTDAPNTDKPTKKPSSVLLLLSTALDKAIAATTKLPTQQMASDAASVFLLLGQVFSEAIDKVIGDDGPEEGVTEITGLTDATEETPSSAALVEELTQLPFIGQSEKVEKQPSQPQVESSQSELKFPSS
ncbi:uncharacterized protein LOC129941582 [Eupeodes corollae]|uniref:uncharacterized protein LOC129941582 n=1 Tax=Eupeodes corollae TaxID=290404 RepID=UPI002491F02D|nr:uncharacterized protein LOC129941582 [Eupeodes corollae]